MGWKFLIIPGWRSPPTSFQTTSDEKWRKGRRGMEVKRRRSSNFWVRGLFSTSGVSVWWGAFPQCGNIPLLMTGSKISTSCKKVKVNPWWRQSGVFYFRTELSDFNQFETRLFAWKWKWCGFVLIFWICSFDCFYLQYLKRSRLTWKCSSNKPNSERQPLIAVKRDNIEHLL